jgi:hypothetical protein
MPLPALSNSQIESIIYQVVEYIEIQRQTYRQSSVPLSVDQRNIMARFFSQPALEMIHLVTLAGNWVGNPPFYSELVQLGFSLGVLPDFSTMTAITFVDTVVSRGPFTYSVLFHELVHVVQYEKLGLPEFAEKYVRGFLSGGSYEAIPLERNAYELEGRFVRAPASSFSVSDEVQRWVDANRF